MSRSERERAQAGALRARGLANREIAERLGLPTGTVANWLRERPSFGVRTCRLCGEPFVPTNGRQQFCTPAHRRAHQRGGPTIRACRLCGQQFAPTNARQRFCTPAHQREHRRRHGPPHTVAGWRERVRALEAELARWHSADATGEEETR